MNGANRFYVYEHWRPDTGTCFYVGFGQRFRSGRLKGRNRYHANVLKKLDRMGLNIEVRRIAASLTRDQAIAKEVERIAYWRSMGVKLTNMTDGGDGVHNVVPAVRQRIAMALKGNAHSIGTKRTPEQRAAISARMVGNTIWLGRKLTEKHRSNLSIAHKGRHFITPRNKAVVCVTDGIQFISAGSAARHYGMHPTQVSQVCLHYAGSVKHQHRKSAAGKVFKYMEAA